MFWYFLPNVKTRVFLLNVKTRVFSLKQYQGLSKLWKKLGSPSRIDSITRSWQVHGVIFRGVVFRGVAWFWYFKVLLMLFCEQSSSQKRNEDLNESSCFLFSFWLTSKKIIQWQYSVYVSVFLSFFLFLVKVAMTILLVLQYYQPH